SKPASAASRQAGIIFSTGCARKTKRKGSTATRSGAAPPAWSAPPTVFCNLQPVRLLDYLENFILFYKDSQKIIAQNHQTIGVNRALARLAERDGSGKLGMFWHTDADTEQPAPPVCRTFRRHHRPLQRGRQQRGAGLRRIDGRSRKVGRGRKTPYPAG